MEAKILEISNSLSNIKLKLQGSCYGADTSSLVFRDKNVGDCVDTDDDGKNSKEKDNDNTIESRNIGGLGDVIEVDNEKVDEDDDDDDNERDEDDLDEKENDERRRHSDDDSNSDNDGKGPNKDNIVLNEGNISVENINKSSGSGDKEDGKEVGGEEIDNAVSTILLMKSTKFFDLQNDINTAFGPYEGKSITDYFIISMVDNLPYQTSSDCSIFILTFAEYFASGVNMSTARFSVDDLHSRYCCCFV
eukprot:XP_015580104.1 putative uncharacterized protein DDB_G0270496 [Ricinus communis]